MLDATKFTTAIEPQIDRNSSDRVTNAYPHLKPTYDFSVLTEAARLVVTTAGVGLRTAPHATKKRVPKTSRTRP
jgi:hypothetical protein